MDRQGRNPYRIGEEMQRTKKQTIAAGNKALKTLPNKGKGWRLRVWENLGWHFNLQRGYASISESFGGEYYCLITDDPSHLGSGCGAWHDPGGSCKTPWKAFEHAANSVLTYVAQRTRTFSEIKTSIMDTFGEKS
jgi:hypothetical protein